MKYVNANTILPSALVEELQKYIQRRQADEKE